MKERAVATNMVGFLQKLNQAIDDNSNEQIVAVYANFSEAFDKAPHLELIKKIADV